MSKQRSRIEIANALTPCGGLSYQNFINLLYSIPFIDELLGDSLQGIDTAFLTGSGFADINRGTGKVKIQGQVYVATTGFFFETVEGEGLFITVNNNTNGLSYVYYNKVTKSIDVYNYTALDQLEITENFLLGVFFGFLPGSLVTSSLNKLRFGGVPDYLCSYRLSFTDEVVFDKQTSVLSIPGLLLSNINGGAVGISPGNYATTQNPKPFDFVVPPNGQALFFDRRLFDAGSFPFVIKEVGQPIELDKEIQLIGINFNNFFTSPYNITSKYNLQRDLIQKSEAFIVGTGYTINIDSNTKKLTAQNGNGGLWLSTANSFTPINIGVTDRLDSDGSLFFVWVKKADMKIYYSGYENVSNYKLEEWYFIGSFWSYDIQSFQGNVRLSINGETQSGSLIVPTGESILPKNIYLISGKTLPLYKKSIKRNKREMKAKTALVQLSEPENEFDFDYPSYNFFDDQILLVPEKLKPNIQINSIDENDSTKYFVSPVIIKKRDTAPFVGQTIKGQQIGDSLTNRGVSKYVANYLTNLGIVYNTFGTLNNQGKQGEGREGWTFSNFIGRDNFFDFGGVPIVRMPIPSDGDGNKNPFLKLANSSDKSVHPDWCFRNTGSQNELSYTTDPIKSGNFYIFDYAYYMASYGIPSDIQVITIALSTNDYTLNEPEALQRCIFGLTVMLTQIKAVLPNVKIGVIPAPAQGMSNEGDSRFNNVADWINSAQKLITDLSFIGVDIIGVWAHMSRFFNWDNAGTAPLRQDGNSSLLYANGEWIHFNTNGYKQYAPVVANWIINVI